MIISINNILLLPIALILSAINAYLFLVMVRFVNSHTVRSSIEYPLRTLTDPVPAALERWLYRFNYKVLPRWGAWIIVVVTLLLLQKLLGAMLLRAR